MKAVVDLKSRRRGVNHKILEELFRAHGEALRCFLVGRVRNGSDIEDIIQDVFVRLARQDDLTERYSEGQRKNRAYIFTAANNMIVDLERRHLVRSQYSQEKQSQQGFGTDERSPCVIAVAQQHLCRMKESIKELKPEWRTAFILNRYKHMTYREIAEVMGVTPRQVETYITQSVLKLKRCVEALPKEGNPPGEVSK